MQDAPHHYTLQKTLLTKSAVLEYILKREDLLHGGAHKINNAIGQALLAKKMNKKRIIAETGAGQHGVATAMACSALKLPCLVYMGYEDTQRQQLNVYRMELLGSKVQSVKIGSQTLKDAINEAIRDWIANITNTHYLLGSAVGTTSVSDNGEKFPKCDRQRNQISNEKRSINLLMV